MDANAVQIGVEGASPPPSADGRRAATIDLRWRELTDSANRAYQTGDLQAGRRFYDEALKEAERLFDLAATGVDSFPAAVIYNVSCHNLAELLQRSDDPAGAEALLQQAFEKLTHGARSPETPLPLRIACVQNLQHALAVFVESLTRRGAAESQIAQVVERARTAAFAVFHAAKHLQLAQDARGHCGGFSS